jgi:hypothetical protein
MKNLNSLNALIEKIESNNPDYINLLLAEDSDEIFNAFSNYLAGAAAHLEKNANHYNCLDEEALSSIVAAKLSVPGIRVMQEEHSKGHVDLTFEIGFGEPYKTILGEAKIHKGPQYHVEGLKQLLTRYCTGRETLGAVINYVKLPNIKDLMKNIQDEFNKSKPENQIGNTKSHGSVKWSFQSSHQHSSGEEITAYHIGCNLYVAGKIATNKSEKP